MADSDCLLEEAWAERKLADFVYTDASAMSADIRAGKGVECRPLCGWGI